MKCNYPNWKGLRPLQIPKLWLLVIFTLSFAMAFGQKSYTVSGNVKDNLSGIPGAAVMLEGTSTGTVTDQDGNYRLTFSSDQSEARLTFSLIGYASQTQTVALTSENITVNVTLAEEVKQLDEVVVTGSSLRAAKRELGNNITSVNSKALENSGTGNLFGALQGKIPGAQITQNSGDPAGGITIRLRGVKSIQGNSDPLYIIDGVVSSNSTANVSQTPLSNSVGAASLGNNRLVDINPSDIESINIISGAAAAAQYGSRASNGVVLITTKKGSAGAPKVSFSTSFNVNELRKRVPITTYGKQFGTTALRLHTIGAAPGGVPFVPIVRDGVTTNLASGLVDVNRYDYQDQIFQTGYGTDNNISVTGGNDKTQYFSSFSYLFNEGIIRKTDFERYTLRTRIDQRLADWAKVSVGLTYANSFANEKANGNVFYSPINSVNITNNIVDITQRDASGNLLPVEQTRVNPLSTIDEMKFTQSVNRTIGSMQLNLNPIKGLGIDWILGVDSYAQVGQTLIEAYPYAAASNLPANLYPNGFASSATNDVLLFNNDLNISYEWQINDDLKLNAIVGTNYQYQRSDFVRGSGELIAPFIESVSGASSTISTGYGLDRFDLFGYFGQATIGYKNLAFITAAIRRDRSSKFTPSVANQTYPKLSGSVVLSDLNIWRNSLGSYVNTFKLRASYGEAGNFTGIDSYARFWQFNPTPFVGKPTLVAGSQLANINIQPERMKEIEVGADLGFWDNRIALGLTYYNQEISDLVVNRVLAASEGGTSIVNNVGEMKNNGIELSLNVNALRTNDFSWDVGLIYSRNRNKITRLGSPTVAIASSAGAPATLVEGQPASVFYGTFYARNENGDLLLTAQGLPQQERGAQVSSTPLEYTTQRNASGQPTGSVLRKVIGDPNPDFTGSITNSLSYKNFTFSFLIDIVSGVDVFNADKRTRQNVGIGDLAEQEMKGELPRGYIFSLVPIEEFRVDDGSYTKLREISLSYNWKSPFRGVRNLNIGLSGRNLISWDNYNGYDPETNAGGNSDLLRGVDFGNVPIPRTYKVQLTFNF